MSELKAFESERIYWAVEQVEQVAGDIDSLHLDDNLFYIKSEVDKVIAEKDKEIVELKADYKEACGRLQTANLIKDEQLAATRHSKYKRCLAMAKWCETRHFIIRYIQADKILNDENYIGTFYYIRREYMIKHYCRWANKWLELAEKFKEAK